MSDYYLSPENRLPRKDRNTEVKSVSFPISDNEDQALDNFFPNKSQSWIKSFHENSPMPEKNDNLEKINFGNIFEV